MTIKVTGARRKGKDNENAFVIDAGPDCTASFDDGSLSLKGSKIDLELTNVVRFSIEYAACNE